MFVPLNDQWEKQLSLIIHLLTAKIYKARTFWNWTVRAYAHLEEMALINVKSIFTTVALLTTSLVSNLPLIFIEIMLIESPTKTFSYK